MLHTIHSLKAGAFANVTNLIYLNLEFNNLTHIHKDAFIGLGMLQVLVISTYGITHSTTPTGLFVPLFRVVGLEFSSLEEVSHLKQLEKFAMDFSYSLEDKIPELKSLKELSYENIDKDVFTKEGVFKLQNTSVEHLRIKSPDPQHPIVHIEENAFYTWTTLKTLDLFDLTYMPNWICVISSQICQVSK